MQILLATGIFLPEAGGPATYVLNLAKELVKSGHKVFVVSYSDQDFYELDKSVDFEVVRVVRKNGVGGKFLNYYNYYKKLKALYNKNNFDILYAFDHFSAGMPASVLAKKIKKPFVVRVGGDFLWEKMVNSGKCNLPLAEYYQQPKSLVEKVYLNIFKYIFKKADKIIFNTAWQKKLYEDVFLLNSDKNLVINNVFTKPEQVSFVDSKEIIFAGRFIKLKNIENLIKAFSQIKTDKNLVIIGDGPEKKRLESLVKNYHNIKIEGQLTPIKLKERLSNAHAFILPSVSELSPNSALEALSAGKLVILTENNALPKALQDCFYLVDPFSVMEIKEALEFCLSEDNYQLYLNKIKECNFNHTWVQVAQEHLDLFISL